MISRSKFHEATETSFFPRWREAIEHFEGEVMDHSLGQFVLLIMFPFVVGVTLFLGLICLVIW